MAILKQVPAFHLSLQLKLKTNKMSSFIESSVLPLQFYSLKYKRNMSKLDILP